MFGSTHWLSRHWTWLNWLVVNRPATQQSRHVPHLLHGSKCKSTHSYEHPQRERLWERGRKRESYQLCIEWLHLREYRNNQTSCFLSSTTACAHWTHLRRGNVGEILSWCCNPFQLRGVFFPPLYFTWGWFELYSSRLWSTVQTGRPTMSDVARKHCGGVYLFGRPSDLQTLSQHQNQTLRALVALKRDPRAPEQIAPESLGRTRCKQARQKQI